MLKNVFTRVIINYNRAYFTFKFSKPDYYKDNGLRQLNPKIKVLKSEEILTQIIHNYKKNQHIYETDMKYFVRFIKFYTIPESKLKEVLPLIMEIMVYSSKMINQQTVVKNAKDNSYFVNKLIEPDRGYGRNPAPIYEIFNMFRTFLERHLKVLSIEDFHSIFINIKKIKGSHFKFQYILAEFLHRYIDNILSHKQNDNKMNNYSYYDVDYIEKNIKLLIDLSKLPESKGTIMKLINFALKNKPGSFSEETSRLVSANLEDKNSGNEWNLAYNFSRIVVSGKIQALIDQMYTDSEVFKLFTPMSVNKMETLDKELSRQITELYFNNKNDESLYSNAINKINRLFDNLSGPHYLRIEKLKYFHELLGASTKILNDILETKTKSNRTNLREISAFLFFFTKYYTDFKHYLFTNENQLVETFTKFHGVFLPLLNKISNVHYENFISGESEELMTILSILFTATLNNLKFNTGNDSHLIDKLVDLISNKNKSLDCLNLNSLSTDNKAQVLKKLIIIISDSSKNMNQDRNLKVLIHKYLDLFPFIQSSDINYYFLDLNMILYRTIINNFEDEELILKMLTQLTTILKVFSLDDFKYYNRLMQVIKNLKIISEGKIYHNLAIHNTLRDIEDIFLNLDESEMTKRDLWWDKANFVYNKYNKWDIVTKLQKFGTVDVDCYFKKLFVCDFKITNNNEVKYIDFISPFHILNTSNIDDFQTLNNKFIKKQKIFNYEKEKLINIPYHRILEGLENLDQYLL